MWTKFFTNFKRMIRFHVILSKHFVRVMYSNHWFHEIFWIHSNKGGNTLNLHSLEKIVKTSERRWFHEIITVILIHKCVEKQKSTVMSLEIYSVKSIYDKTEKVNSFHEIFKNNHDSTCDSKILWLSHHVISIIYT